MKKKQRNTTWAVGNGTTHPLVEAYTAGDDYVFDQKLLSCDIQASIAHAEMLKKIGVLTAQELRAAKKGLAKAQALWKRASSPSVRRKKTDIPPLNNSLPKISVMSAKRFTPDEVEMIRRWS